MKNIYIIICYVILTVGFASCDLWSDVEDAQPYFLQTEDASYSTEKGIEANVSGMYAKTRGFNVHYPANYASELAGLYLPSWQNESDQTNVLLTITDLRTGSIYQDFYSLITNANYLIKNLKDLNEGDVLGLTMARRDEIIGEAKIARAMGHFELLKVFGQHYDINSSYGIPVVLNIPKEAQARNSVSEVYDALYKDLTDALAEAPEGVNRQKFTQITAKAIKAKVALYKKDYNVASTLANEVINDGEFSLELDFKDVFDNGLASEEVIFSPYTIFYSETLLTENAYRSKTSPLMKSIADAQVDGAGNDATGEGYDPRYANSHATDLVSFINGKYPPKWVVGQPATSYNYLRLAELYLIYAEAEARLSADNVDDDHFKAAVAAVKTIRDRVGLPELTFTNKAQLLEQIRIEKIMELHLEYGEPWMDMVRYHFIGDIDIKTIRPVVKEDWQLIYPLNLTTLNANPLLKQNPGYIGSN
jgi:hypothetical protein